MTEKSIVTNLLNPSTWIRLIFMAIIALLLMVSRVVIWVVALLQFLMVLITARDNDNLRDLGQGLSKWAFQGHMFLTFNSEEKPFPFSDWPVVDSVEPYQAEVEEQAGATSAAEHDDGDAESQQNDELDESDVPSFTDEGVNPSDDVDPAKK